MEISHENYNKIYSVAFALYDSFRSSDEINKISTLVVDSIRAHQANHYFERAIIATLCYFRENNFKIATNIQHLNDPNLHPYIPQNWRDAITFAVNVILDEECRFASYFVRKNSQTYKLVVSSTCQVDSGSGSVGLLLTHCGNDRTFSTSLRSSEVNGLSEHDRNFATMFANHVLKILGKAWHLPVQKSGKDQAPSTPASPML